MQTQVYFKKCEDINPWTDMLMCLVQYNGRSAMVSNEAGRVFVQAKVPRTLGAWHIRLVVRFCEAELASLASFITYGNVFKTIIFHVVLGRDVPFLFFWGDVWFSDARPAAAFPALMRAAPTPARKSLRAMHLCWSCAHYLLHRRQLFTVATISVW